MLRDMCCEICAAQEVGVQSDVCWSLRGVAWLSTQALVLSTKPQNPQWATTNPSNGIPSSNASSRSSARKLVIIGDGATGKTSLLSVFTLGFFPKDYVCIPHHQPGFTASCPPSLSTTSRTAAYAASRRPPLTIQVDGKSVQLALWYVAVPDTAGQEDYERLRPLCYNKSHVIVIAYSVDNPDSLENVQTKVFNTPPFISHCKWYEEATSLCPGVPIILVGLKADLRRNPQAIEAMRLKSLNFVDSKEAEAVSRSIGAKKFLECSALESDKVDDVFEAATRAAITFQEASDSGGVFANCCVLF
ncbi:GTP-binding protein rho2 [Neolecta irregularis DAH-3]|uniref:GTP-binding protein rho2 n=1 Tax=Neolecta irregularis (strain DAH-3) TaxID=1198029 RepID=A0A1U7LRZ0_NEOID|nr:GTP-binding protein rho2 [Neolecta irregularis DAH-3]|eukprot:OLL25436.1 GTP-binding protein rho2 [Neolecta irregularis DAH-3]